MLIGLDRLLKFSDISGIAVFEHASYLHGISTFPPEPMMIQQEVSHSVNSGVLQIISVDRLDYRYTDKITDKLFVTNVERTICDLIRFDRDIRVIFESIDRYLRHQDSTIDPVLEVAKEYGIRDLVLNKWEEIKILYKDFYNYE